jgi:hypothetical protein
MLLCVSCLTFQIHIASANVPNNAEKSKAHLPEGIFARFLRSAEHAKMLA